MKFPRLLRNKYIAANLGNTNIKCIFSLVTKIFDVDCGDVAVVALRCPAIFTLAFAPM